MHITNLIQLKRSSILIVSVVVLLSLGFFAYANAQDENNKITVCVNKAGIMRMIGNGLLNSKCFPHETKMVWNVQGIKGEKGDTGEQGEAGLMGMQGIQWKQGLSGNDGKDGKDGVSIPCLRVEGNDVIFEGCNVHIRDGSGDTLGITNGLGNLIIGYNENPNEYARTGSHNLVIGPYHEYTSFGGFVSGQRNRINGASSFIGGGSNNQTLMDQSTILGGQNNITRGNSSAICGGFANEAKGDNSGILGGSNNATIGNSSSISGGRNNKASEMYSSVTGGEMNEAKAMWSTVSGGRNRTSLDAFDWVAGALSEDQ